MRKTLLIILLAAATRVALSQLTDHPGIITPIIGMAIFTGCHLKKWWGSLIMLGAMFISDYFLGLYDWKLMSAVYGSILLAYLIGKLIKNWYSVISASIAVSLVYFIITNFAVWEFTSWYPHTKEGLILCYTMAIPYLKLKLLTDLGWTLAIFGSYALAKQTEKTLCVSA